MGAKKRAGIWDKFDELISVVKKRRYAPVAKRLHQQLLEQTRKCVELLRAFSQYWVEAKEEEEEEEEEEAEEMSIIMHVCTIHMFFYEILLLKLFNFFKLFIFRS